jgi:hypothetical protein
MLKTPNVRESEITLVSHSPFMLPVRRNVIFQCLPDLNFVSNLHFRVMSSEGPAIIFYSSYRILWYFGMTTWRSLRSLRIRTVIYIFLFVGARLLLFF